MSSKKEVPKGPTIPRSSVFHDIVVGENCERGTVVARFYGSVVMCGNIIVDDCLFAKCFETIPGGSS